MAAGGTSTLDESSSGSFIMQRSSTDGAGSSTPLGGPGRSVRGSLLAPPAPTRLVIAVILDLREYGSNSFCFYARGLSLSTLSTQYLCYEYVLLA